MMDHNYGFEDIDMNDIVTINIKNLDKYLKDDSINEPTDALKDYHPFDDVNYTTGSDNISEEIDMEFSPQKEESISDATEWNQLPGMQKYLDGFNEDLLNEPTEALMGGGEIDVTNYVTSDDNTDQKLKLMLSAPQEEITHSAVESNQICHTIISNTLCESSEEAHINDSESLRTYYEEFSLKLNLPTEQANTALPITIQYQLPTELPQLREPAKRGRKCKDYSKIKESLETADATLDPVDKKKIKNNISSGICRFNRKKKHATNAEVLRELEEEIVCADNSYLYTRPSSVKCEFEANSIESKNQKGKSGRPRMPSTPTMPLVGKNAKRLKNNFASRRYRHKTADIQSKLGRKLEKVGLRNTKLEDKHKKMTKVIDTLKLFLKPCS